MSEKLEMLKETSQNYRLPNKLTTSKEAILKKKPRIPTKTFVESVSQQMDIQILLKTP